MSVFLGILLLVTILGLILYKKFVFDQDPIQKQLRAELQDLQESRRERELMREEIAAFDKKHEGVLQYAHQPQDEILNEKECPHCAEIIKAKAKKCKHCGEMLNAVIK